MSDATIEQVKNELEQTKTHMKGVVAQLEAIKQMYNESLQSAIQLRSNVILFQQANQELNQENHVLKDQLAALQPVVVSQEVQPE